NITIDKHVSYRPLHQWLCFLGIPAALYAFIDDACPARILFWESSPRACADYLLGPGLGRSLPGGCFSGRIYVSRLSPLHSGRWNRLLASSDYHGGAVRLWPCAEFRRNQNWRNYDGDVRHF